MPKEPDDIQVGDIVTVDTETFGNPIWIDETSKKYRITKISSRPGYLGREHDIVYIENLDGSSVERPYVHNDDLGISILWFYKYNKPTNAERIQQRKEELCITDKK